MDEDELDELRARAVALRGESARLLRELDAEPWYLRRWPYLSGRAWRRWRRLEELERAMDETIAALQAALAARPTTDG
jgi:hypothetical protein